MYPPGFAKVIMYHSTRVKKGSGIGIVVNTRLDNAEAPICLTGENHLIQTI